MKVKCLSGCFLVWYNFASLLTHSFGLYQVRFGSLPIYSVFKIDSAGVELHVHL